MIPFTKYSGAGNDFVLVDAARGVDDPESLARAICPRGTGVGVDGMALVRSVGDGEVAVRFFNPDGSEFAVCGNGSRCVARWAADAGLARDGRLTLTTRDGDVEARVGDRDVALVYALDVRIEGRRTVPFGGRRREGWLVRTGTPHFVLLLERLPDGPIEDLCRPVRRQDALGPEGANVNLVAEAGTERVRIRTYERGVEAETRACGAGAISAAVALHAAGAFGPDLRLETRGGEELRVELDPGGEAPPVEPPRRIRLTGPARFVFEGRFPWPRGSGPRDAHPRGVGTEGATRPPAQGPAPTAADGEPPSEPADGPGGSGSP